MSYTLHNELHGIAVWFNSGGWIVLLVIAVAVAAIIMLLNDRWP